jgi:dTDP-4-amino-4,6-dideoxygalactose transaminase
MSKILVTKPFQASYEEVSAEIQRAWDAQWLTNNGPLLYEFEEKLNGFLGTVDCSIVSNGTIAIQVAIKAFDLSGEIITTPFSYVATTSSIVWEGCTPVFVDIDAVTFNIDVDKIEAAITEKTSAILATHVFGVPCNVEAIAKLADHYNLKVIYDAAHCFGTEINGKSVMTFGHLSTLSLHATKLMHCVEGGAIFINDHSSKVDTLSGKVSPLRYRIDRLRNFGHYGPEVFDGVGINAKNSEIHSAIGLVNLRYAEEIISDRARQHDVYNSLLLNIGLKFPHLEDNVKWNKSYYPVVFQSEQEAMYVKNGLEKENIIARRYFYPALNTLPYIEERGDTPVASAISKSILCLPLYFGLEKEKIIQISRIVVELCGEFRS